MVRSFLCLMGRLLVVLASMVLSMLVLQGLFTRDAVIQPRFSLHVTESGAKARAGGWDLSVSEYWDVHLDGRPARLQEALDRLQPPDGPLELTAVDDRSGEVLWRASRRADGQFELDGKAISFAGLRQRILDRAVPKPEEITRPVTILDLLEANLPTPTRSKVSSPRFSYREAFPEANDAPEIVIGAFHEAPMIQYMRDPNRIPAGGTPADLALWKQVQWHYRAGLPPVEDRLPVNPAVVVGPDGLGQYGGVWRRCQVWSWDFMHQICYESFTRHDPSGRLVPCLAYQWTVSPDSRVFTFYLRKGHRWSDGAPFTSHDITWTCNEVIGSDYWSMPPDWMQATDGSMMLYEEDVSDWTRLAQRIVAEARGGRPSPGGQIAALADAGLWGRIEALADGNALPRDLPRRVTDELNELFRKRGFYSPQAFAGVDLGAERRELEAAGPSRLDGDQMDCLLLMIEREDLLKRLGQRPNDPNVLEPIELNRLNLLLFRSAYRDLVGPPVKQRVKVQAVPDEAGDDSHIVRFTFRKPNSIFLEQTATFMFYRGLFNLPRHVTAAQHAYGSSLLAPGDVWDWPGLLRRINAEAQAQALTPGKRLWQELDEPTRLLVAAGPPAQQRGEDDDRFQARLGDYQQRVLEGFNAALKRRGFYDPNAWPNLDPAAARAKLLAEKGFAQTMRDLANLEEYRDWLVLEDLLGRMKADGPDSLSDAEHLKVNMMAFRAAYGGKTDQSVLAATREMGLDRQAAHDPRKFTSWTRRLFYRSDYHPQANPHHPYLGAWRLVSVKDEPEMLAIRNPYYYRVDAAGNQLPYLDAVRHFMITQKEVRLLKLTSGNVDFQTAPLTFDDFTVLKQKEKAGGYQVRLWASDCCGMVSFLPLQSHKDPAYAHLQEDPNFRYALSLALNRQEIIDVVFSGLGTPAAHCVPRGSKYYNPNEATAFIEHDPGRANRLLDAMGLNQRAADGTRRLPDGRPLILDLNITLEFPLSVARLAVKYWHDVGLNVQIKQRTPGMVTRLEEMGLCDLEGADGSGSSFFGPMLPAAYYPSHPAEAVQWCQWATYLRSGGRSGWPAPERIKELDRMWTRFAESPTLRQKMANWKAITDRFARDLPILGISTSPGKVVYVRNGFKNVPKLAMGGWIAHDPGNCCPECFYIER